jgi:hypothetical protein
MIWSPLPHDAGNEEEIVDIRGRLRRASGTRFDEAIAFAVALRRFGVSHDTVVFELCHRHGFEKVAATRIVRIAAARDALPTNGQPNAAEPPVEVTAADVIAELAARIEALEAKA